MRLHNRGNGLRQQLQHKQVAGLLRNPVQARNRDAHPVRRETWTRSSKPGYFYSTLAGTGWYEVLITLAIIGVVAAVSIPSVISNSNQQQYKTGLKKAVSVLNSAITMGMAKEGVSPYDLSADYRLFDYLQKHMNVLKSTTDVSTIFMATKPGLFLRAKIATR